MYILMYSVNEYNQYGDYIHAIYNKKPSFEQLYLDIFGKSNLYTNFEKDEIESFINEILDFKKATLDNLLFVELKKVNYDVVNKTKPLMKIRT